MCFLTGIGEKERVPIPLSMVVLGKALSIRLEDLTTAVMSTTKLNMREASMNTGATLPAIDSVVNEGWGKTLDVEVCV